MNIPGISDNMMLDHIHGADDSQQYWQQYWHNIKYSLQIYLLSGHRGSIGCVTDGKVFKHFPIINKIWRQQSSVGP